LFSQHGQQFRGAEFSVIRKWSKTHRALKLSLRIIAAIDRVSF